MNFISKYNDEMPKGLKKILFLNWPLLLLIISVSSFGFLMLYSVANGNLNPWSQPQIIRFTIGILILFMISFINIQIWYALSPYIYILTLILLISVNIFGETGMGAKRWIDLKIIKLQPSEFMKIALVMFLSFYYSWLNQEKISKPLWVFIPIIIISIPTFLIILQPDLGTGLLLLIIGTTIMFVSGVSLWYFGALFLSIVPVLTIINYSRDTSWQLLTNYQFKRIDTFLNPSLDPLGSGYHITQSKIALGSGGLTGKGFMQGTQSQLNFLPEKHTDFIFTTIAEEFGFFGTIGLLVIYGTIVLICSISSLTNNHKFGSILTMGITITFFSYFGMNIAMVMGLGPVKGVPLPLVSYGGSALIAVLIGFGLIQSAHIHRLRVKEK